MCVLAESDNESVPSSSPFKTCSGGIHVKTLEEIRLEKIQAESAAFYSFAKEGEEGLKNESKNENSELNFKVMSLQEIRSSRGALDVKMCTLENLSQPDSTTTNQTTGNELETFTDICKSSETAHSLKKPIKLRRCFKRSANDIPVDKTGNKLKRIKFTNGCENSTDVTSTISNELLNKEDKVNSVENSLSSPVDRDFDKYQADLGSKDDSELLKDIDELLCD